MAGLKFDITADDSHFLDAMNSVRESVRQTVSYIEKAGGDIDAVIRRLSGGGTSFNMGDIRSQVDSAVQSFERIITSIGASAEAAEDAKKKFSDTLLSIATSSEDAATKQQRLNEALTGIFTEISNSSGQLEMINAAIDTMNAMSSASTAATGLNATAHGAAALAVGAEASAHGVNAASVSQETTAYRNEKQAIDDVVFTWGKLSKEDSAIDSANVEAIATRFNELKGEIETLQQKLSELKEGTAEYVKMSGQLADAKEYLADFGQAYLNPPKPKEGEESMYTEEQRHQLSQMKAEQEQLTRLQQESTEAEKAQAEATKATSEAVKEKGQAAKGATDNEKNAYDALQQKIEAYKKAIAENEALLEKLTSRSISIGDKSFDFNIPKVLLDDGGREMFSEISDKIKEQKQALSELEEKLKEYKEATKAEEGESHVLSINERLEQQKGRLEDLNVELENYQKRFDKLANASNLTTKQQEEYDSLIQKIKETEKAIEGAKQSMTEIRGETFIGRLRNGVDSLGESFDKVKEDITSKIKKPFEDLAESISNSKIGQRFAAETTQLKGALGDVNDKITGFLTGHGRFQQALLDSQSAFSGMLGPIAASVRGIQGMTVAMMKMAMTPLGAVIAAIVIALKAMHTWFTKSSEGQLAFAKISGYLGSIVNSLTDIFIKFGKYVYNAFFKSDGAMRGFATNLVTTLKNAVKTAFDLISGLGKTLKGLGQMLTGDFSEGWETIKEGGAQIGKSFTEAIQTVKSAFTTAIEGMKGAYQIGKDAYDTFSNTDIKGELKNILNTASRMGEISKQQKLNAIEIGKAKEKEVEMDEKIRESQEKIYTLSGKAKLEEIERLKTLQKEKFKDRIAAYEKAYNLQKETNKLHTSDMAALSKERQLHTELLQLKAQQAGATRFATRMEQSTLRTMANEAKKNAKNAENERKKQEKINAATAAAEGSLSKLLFSQEQERIKAEKDLESKIADAKIAALEEGAEKTIAVRNRQHEKELAELDKQKEAAIEKERKNQMAVFEAEQKVIKAKGGKPKQWSEDMFNENDDAVKKIKELYGNLYKEITDKQANEDKKVWESIVKKHQSYTDKKLEIEKKYEEEIKEIDTSIAEAEKKGQKDVVEQLKRTRKKALEDRNKELSAIEMQILKESPEYVMAFENLSRASSETLKNLIQKFEDAKQHAAETMTPDQFREFMTTLDKMYDEVNNRNPFDVLTNSVQKLKAAQDSLEVARGIYDDVTAGKERINPVTGKAYTEEEARRNLVNAMEAESRAYDNVIKKVVACGDKLRAFGGTLSQLGQMIGGDVGKGFGAVGGIFDSVGGVMSSIKNYDRNATGLSKVMQNVSLVTTAASAMISMNQQLDSILPDQQSLYEHYAKKQAEINRQRRAIMELVIAQFEQRLKDENWFYSNSLTQLKENEKIHQQYLKAYGDIAAAPQEVYKEASSGFAKWGPAVIGAIVGIVAGVLTFGSGAGLGVAVGSAIGTAVGSTAIGAALGATTIALIGTIIASGVGAAVGNIIRSGWDSITYESGQTAALNNLRVQTRHKTAFRSEKTQDLESWVRENWKGQELYNKELTERYGVPMVDTEVVKKLLSEDGPTLVGETRETLEKLLEYSENINKFLEEVRDYVSKAFSPLVDDLTNAVWDWLKDGKDVMDSFREYAADTFKSIAQDALKSMANQLIFSPFKKQLEDLVTLYSSGAIDETAYMAGVSAIAGDMQTKVQQNLPVLENAAKVMQTAFDNVGIDIVGTSEKAAGSVDDLRSTFVSALKDMGKSSDDFRRTLQESLFDELVNDMVLNEDFENWFNEWRAAYREAVDSGDIDRMTVLLEENVQKREELSEKTRQIAEDIGYSAAISNSLDNLSSTFLDNLLDMDSDASEMGKNIANTLIKEMLQTMLASEKYKSRINEIKKRWQQILNGEDVSFTMDDVMKDIADLNDEIANDEGISALTQKYKELNKTADSVFNNLRSTFMSTLTSMSDDAEAFRKNLEQTMLVDLIERQTLDVPITVNGMSFDDFNAYVEDWNERYAIAVKEGNREAIDALLAELVEVRSLTLAQAEELREQLKALNEDDTFKGMTGSFISALMDTNKTAVDWAQDIGRTMAQRIIEQMVSVKMIQPLLDNLQTAFNAAMGAENATYESVLSDVGVSNALTAIRNAFPGLQSVAKGIMESLGLKNIGNGFSNLRDTFVNTLLGMDDDAQVLGKNLAVTMMEQMLNTLVDKQYADQMKQINEEWALALESGDATKIDTIRQKVINLYETIGNDSAVKKLTSDIKALTDSSATPFDSLRSSFLSALTDMNKSAQDFTKEISTMIAQSFIDSFVMGDMFDEKLADWKRKYRDITTNAGLTEDERMRQLRGLSALISQERTNMQGEVNEIYKMLGVRDYKDQTATMNMAEAATYDQFELYLGMETSHLMVAEQTKGMAQQIVDTLRFMSGATSSETNYQEQIFMRLGTTNEYLLAVKKATEGIRSEFAIKLDRVNAQLAKWG